MFKKYKPPEKVGGLYSRNPIARIRDVWYLVLYHNKKKCQIEILNFKL